MESLKEVLIRVKGVSEEGALSKIDEAKSLLDEGVPPEEVLVSLYGCDAEELEDILSPAMSTV